MATITYNAFTSLKKIGDTAISILRVVMHSRLFLKLPLPRTPNLGCTILGNGPSLSQDVDILIASPRSMDCICVNRFVESEIYERVRPKYYVFTDPLYWEVNLPERVVKEREILFQQIISKTLWKLSILAPHQSKRYFEQQFGPCKNVSVLYYNFQTVRGYWWLEKAFYGMRLGMPRPQNVLIAALMLAMQLGYKSIILLGADHSWHTSLCLDESNRLCLRDLHFYDKNAELTPFTVDGSDDNIFTMATLFSAIARMFDGYTKVQQYAESQNVSIVNASSITFIDAFRRVKLCELFKDDLV